MGRKIGILGGTFNPIHNGHLSLAKTAFEQLNLDQIWFMPSGQTNLKKGLYILPKEHRIKLIELAIKDFPCFELSQLEIQRPGITYTFETLLQLEQMYPQDSFYFIMGADCLFSIERWKEPEIIMNKTSLVTAVRGDADLDKLNQQATYLTDKYGAVIYLLNFPAISVSSSEIRSKISNDEFISDLIPQKVEEYINEHFLFKGMGNA